MRTRVTLSAFVAVLAGTLAAPLGAQGVTAGVSYDWSLPVGDLKTFADNDSWLGFTLDLRKRNPTGSFTYGALFGYYEFYRMYLTGSGTTIVFPGGALTGQQYHHLFSFPMMLSAEYHFGDSESGVRPYLGLAAGISYLKQTVDIGIYTVTADAWKPAVAPEVGFSFNTAHRTQVNVHARYYLATKSDNLYANATPGASMQYLSIGIGLMGRVF